MGNLNFSTNWQKLKDYMKKAGNVLFADVFMDHKGRSKGCGLENNIQIKKALIIFFFSLELKKSGGIFRA